MTRLILCADDYGLAPGVSRAIARLLTAGRLSATSCITVTETWREQAAALKPLAERADIGLHLTLTHLRPLAPLPRLALGGNLPQPGRLMTLALLRRLPVDEIAAEFARQLDAFEREMGRPPAFLDGHLHVQQLPAVREVVIALWQRRLKGTSAWLRVADGVTLAHGLKGLVIGLLGRGLRARAVEAGIAANDRFSGVYDLTNRVPYAARFERFLADIAGAQHPLIMCHPGEVDDELRRRDPVTDAREAELRYFESAAFNEALQRHGLVLGRFAGP